MARARPVRGRERNVWSSNTTVGLTSSNSPPGFDGWEASTRGGERTYGDTEQVNSYRREQRDEVIGLRVALDTSIFRFASPRRAEQYCTAGAGESNRRAFGEKGPF